MCTSGFWQRRSLHGPFGLRLLTTSPLITTTVDAERPFTGLPAVCEVYGRRNCTLHR